MVGATSRGLTRSLPRVTSLEQLAMPRAQHLCPCVRVFWPVPPPHPPQLSWVLSHARDITRACGLHTALSLPLLKHT